MFGRFGGARLAALAVSGALALGACSTDGQSAADGGPEMVAGFVNVVEGGTPTSGGTLTFGSYSFPNSLDPTKTLAAGSNGGTEMAAIFDTLVRYDPQQREFVPQLAESLTGNDDFTSYTLGLRAGATFSDGSPLDAAAVTWSIGRFIAAKADVAAEWVDVVSAMTVVDPQTITFTLSRSWDDFPVLLSIGPGMIVGQGSEKPGGFEPVGAGPYTLTSFAPQEEIAMAPNPAYFAGRPNIDKLRFVPTAGASAQLESLNSGQLDMAFIMRDEAVIKTALEANRPGYLAITGLGNIGLINNRAGRPGEDLRVRRAIALGIDPEAVNQRANAGLGIASSEFLPANSHWANGVAGLPYDAAESKRLLGEAKADGYDGRLTYVATSEQSAQAAALAAQASLNAIGFEVSIDTVASVSDLVRRMFVEHDFDVTRSGYPFMDEAPYLRLFSGFGGASHSNSAGYVDPQMDELFLAVQTATTDEAKREALGQVQARFNETVPSALWGPTKIFTVWDEDVRGVKRSADNIILLDSVWLASR